MIASAHSRWRTAALLCVSGLLAAVPTHAQSLAPLTITEAHRLALEHAEGLAIANEQLASAELGRWRVVTAFAPRVRAGLSYTHEKDGIDFASPGGTGDSATASVVLPQDQRRAVLEIEQPLLVPQIVPVYFGIEHNIEASQEGRAFAAQQTLFAVTEAFYEVLRADEQAQVVGETLTLAEAEERRARLRHEVGEVLKTDLLRSEVATTQAREGFTAAENQTRAARLALARQLGVEEVDLVESPPPPIRPAATGPAAVDIALAARPDLRRLERQLEAAEDEKRRRLAALLPSLGAQGSYQRLSVETFADRDDFWSFMLAVQIPIVDRGGAAWVDVREQTHNIEMARLAVQSLRADVRLQVGQAWLALDTFDANLASAERASGLADETYRLVSKQRDVGIATSLEVMTALTELQRARARLVNTRRGRELAVFALQRVTGVLGKNPDAPAGDEVKEP